MEVHHAELQQERLSAGHSPQSARESENTTGEPHTRLLSIRKHHFEREVIANCLCVDGAAAWLGGGAPCGQ